MINKYTESYLLTIAQDYATKVSSSPNAIIAMSEANENLQTIGAKIAELNAETESSLAELKSLDNLYKECGLNLEVNYSGLYDAKVDKNRKLYAERFPAFYTQAVDLQKKVIKLRKSHLDAALKLQSELVGILQTKYDSSKLMMLEQLIDQQKVLCYILIQEYIKSCQELMNPYMMYKLRDIEI